jgi:UDP-hydrolysing UDP-N-acetyl-D-glucosamine 2-epimerase
MKTIGVVTVARSDYGIYLPILKKIQAHQNLDLYLLVSGMHLSPEFGKTIETIKNDGFPIGDQIEMLVSSDSPEAISKSMGLGTIGFAQSYARYQPDILLVLGDRFEMHAAAVAALPFNIPIAHVHGGESTEGLIDESIRHSLTKMSHLHFASTQKKIQNIRLKTYFRPSKPSTYQQYLPIQIQTPVVAKSSLT